MSENKTINHLIKTFKIEVDENNKIFERNGINSSDIERLQHELDNGIVEGKYKVKSIDYFMDGKLTRTKRLAHFADESKHSEEIRNFNNSLVT